MSFAKSKKICYSKYNFVNLTFSLSDFARVVRLPETQQRSLQQEPFEYSQEPKNEDSDWDQMVKYALRKAER